MSNDLHPHQGTAPGSKIEDSTGKSDGNHDQHFASTGSGLGSEQIALGAEATGPLAGVRIVDLSTVVMAPLATQILGDLGADVIRIEPPFDTARISPTGQGRNAGMGPLYLQVNRNKRSVTLNLKDITDRQRLFNLLETTDVFVTNMRGQALTRLGISYADLHEQFPRLIYLHGQGFNQNSQSANRPAYDEVIQAETGNVDMQRRSAGNLIFMPTFIADKTASLWLVIGALAALYERRETGVGQHVQLPMADAMIHMNSVEHLASQVFEPSDQAAPIGNPLSFNSLHAAFPTADGEAIAAVPYTNADIKLLLGATNDPLADDPQWDAPKIDSEIFTQGLARIHETSNTISLAEWEQYLQHHDFPYAVVRNVDELYNSPYVQELDLMPEVDHPTEGRMRTVANPLDFSRTPVNIRRLAETSGASTSEVLRWLSDR